MKKVEEGLHEKKIDHRLLQEFKKIASTKIITYEGKLSPTITKKVDY